MPLSVGVMNRMRDPVVTCFSSMAEVIVRRSSRMSSASAEA